METQPEQPNNLTPFDWTSEEVAYHEAGHFVVGYLFGMPLGDINMRATKERRASVSATAACDWVREVGGEEGTIRLKQLIAVLVAGEEALFVYGAERGKARWSAAGDTRKIFELLEAAKDETGKTLDINDIHLWMDEARKTVKDKLTTRDGIAWKAVQKLAAQLSHTSNMSAEEANAIVFAALESEQGQS